jgi:hypothetical protein
MTDGRARCRNCYHRDPATWELCGGCGQTKRVNARAADGTARCPNCYRKSSQRKLPCDRCSRLVHPVVRAGVLPGIQTADEGGIEDADVVR